MRDVAFSCDDNGARFLCVTVHSLLEHYRGKEPLRINVFEGFGGHSAESKAKLQSIVDKFGAALRYHDIGKYVEPYADVLMNREGSRWNVFTWTPIFAPQILSDAEGNVAHFDIDMLFNDDVSKILELDLGDNLIAAVAEYGKGDPVITEAVWGGGILPGSVERYFNTGTIVFNTAKCREERTWDRLVAWYRDHYAIADRIEQDAWNALYHDRTLLLPLRWNFHDRLIKSFAKWGLSRKYWLGNPPRECLEAALNPAVLHFWGPKKPWKTSHRPYRKLYHAAMRAVGQTPPREPFCPWRYNWVNGRNLQQLKDRLRGLDDPDWPSWRRHCRVKAVKHALEAPFEWIAILLGLLVFAPLPHRLLVFLCDCASRGYYRFDASGRRRALETLRIVRGRCRGSEGTPAFDPDTAAYDATPFEDKVIRRSYRNMSRTVGHIFWTSFFPRRRAAGIGELSEECRRFLREHRPAITVSGHLGCWENLSQLAFLEGHSMMSVAKRIGTRGMTRMLMWARKAIGQEIVDAEGAFKPLMAGLRGGKSLGLLIDQSVEPRNGGVFVRLFGRPISVSAAPAFFAAKGGAPIVVAWSHPLKDGRYRCEFVSSYAPESARDVWGLTQRIAEDIETVIRRHPSCWILNYNYFSNVPSPEDIATLDRRTTSMGRAG